MYAPEEILVVMKEMPEGAFDGANTDKIVKWIEYVMSVDVNPKDNHEAFYYISLARALGERFGSINPSDYSDQSAREQVANLIAVGQTPYDHETEVQSWKKWKLSAAQMGLALRVVTKAQSPEKTGDMSASTDGEQPTDVFFVFF